MSIRFSRAVFASALGFCCSLPVLLVPLPANAALGGDPMTPPTGSSETTRTIPAPSSNGIAVMRSASSASSGATTSSSSTGASASYTVRQTTLGNGTVIREYISSAGSVFGLAWSGPQMPNLSDLLGSYFPQYVAGVTSARKVRGGGGHGPGIVQDSGLVVHSGGHMGAFSGQAYLPQALPAGVSGTDIQ
ncbi:Protein of unknown function [Burkholderia sp. YR290]|jgi:hypothetical protein|nr:DUF2844 domain-containing protein [Paraburkholderia hospita]OUL75384.1 hypothetical protein CA602_36620 [Paraburkholderia hospita]SKC64677.1 Protein of unknown function [Burkholderia sp. CF099]SOE60815.1 Protein of unknown function [Burkholderia sp. YR290]